MTVPVVTNPRSITSLHQGTSMSSHDLAPRERSIHGTHFDAQLFERLRTQFIDGELNNRPVVLADRQLTTVADTQSCHSKRLEDMGLEKIGDGRVAAVILAGGLATRFGGGAKASVELAPGWSLLRIKLELVAQLARQVGRPVPTWIIVSRSSQDAVVKILDEHSFRGELEIQLLPQRLLPRLDTKGEIFLDSYEQMSYSPPGHGEALRLLGRQCRREGHERIAHLLMSNIDNLLGSLQPEALALQDELDADLVEVVESTEGDAGGVVVQGQLGVEVIEGFRMNGPIPPQPWLLSTNTICLRRLSVVDPPHLPWNAVVKKVGGVEVIQFEQLIGDLGTDRRLRPVLVDRLGPSGRFAPLKTNDEFERLRKPLIGALRGFGLDL
jgi:UTP--glucose-1-phosphate uridylyltransferase